MLENCYSIVLQLMFFHVIIERNVTTSIFQQRKLTHLNIFQKELKLQDL